MLGRKSMACYENNYSGSGSSLVLGVRILLWSLSESCCGLGFWEVPKLTNPHHTFLHCPGSGLWLVPWAFSEPPLWWWCLYLCELVCWYVTSIGTGHWPKVPQTLPFLKLFQQLCSSCPSSCLSTSLILLHSVLSLSLLCLCCVNTT